MPFHNSIYYPYSSDTQGTHSSAGIPSQLNSPLSHHSVPASGMTPSSGTYAAPAFKFHPCRESVDWRRINAVDIDLVVSQLDLDILQEHINTVTFCSLDGERCQRCKSPVDPALVKLLQLAQFTIQWLLHCQEVLASSLRAAEGKLADAGRDREELLADAGRDREELLAQRKKKEEEVKALTTELKHRKKIIRTQQLMFAPQIHSSHKCPDCEKSFLSANFLQGHIQRRHPETYKNQLRSQGEKQSQLESLKSEISNLKELIVQQKQELQTKTAQEKEQQSLHKDLLREMDRFKAEEMARMDRMIDDGIRREMDFMYTRNIQALNEVNQNLTAKQEKSAIPVQHQPERDLENYREMQVQFTQKLQQQMKELDKKWESGLSDIKAQYASEKNELLNKLSRVHSEQESLVGKLQEQERTIKAQREQIRISSSNPPPTKVVEVPVIMTAPAPEPKPKRVQLDSSSFSERRAVKKRPEPEPELQMKQKSTLKEKLRKDMRPAIEQSLIMRLETLGVKSDQTGLKNNEDTSPLAKLHSQSQSFAKGKPDYWRQREEIANMLEQRLGRQRRASDPAPQTQARSRQSAQVLQIRPRSSSMPPKVSKSGPPVKQSRNPQAAPRTKMIPQPKTSTPFSKTALKSVPQKTPPFSSDEDSEEETDMDVEEPQKVQRGKSALSRLNQATPVQIRSNKASSVQTPARHSLTSNQQHARWTLGSPPKTTITKMENDEEDDDWADVSELQEIDPRQLQSHKDQNGNVEKSLCESYVSSENKIKDLARKMEMQFTARAVKKPAGGVSILPQRKDEVQELTCTDLEESSEWVVSSLEDRLEVSKPALGSGPLRKSLDSASTSVWGTSTGKAPKSGLTEAGTGSTLKSSLCSFSDISDSEDSNNKHS